MFSLHIDTARGWRGGQSQVLHLVQGLRAIGHRAALVAHPDGELLRRMSEGHDLIPIAARATQIPSKRPARSSPATIWLSVPVPMANGTPDATVGNSANPSSGRFRIRARPKQAATTSATWSGSPRRTSAARATAPTPPAQPSPNSGERRTSARAPSRATRRASIDGVAIPVVVTR